VFGLLATKSSKSLAKPQNPFGDISILACNKVIKNELRTTKYFAMGAAPKDKMLEL
jgi:hypothetical protein